MRNEAGGAVVLMKNEIGFTLIVASSAYKSEVKKTHSLSTQKEESTTFFSLT